MITSETTPLIVVEDDHLLTNDTVLLGASEASAERIALLTIYPDEPFELIRPVRVMADATLPPSLAIGANLAARCGINEDNLAKWTLRTNQFCVQTATRLQLEMTIDASSDELAKALSQSDGLDGLLLYMSTRDNTQQQTVTIDGTPYRVSSVEPAPEGETVYQIDSRTTAISLLAPTHRTGVDLVILADCSGSMGLPDLTPITDEIPEKTFLQKLGFGGRTSPRITRMQAVRDALMQLLSRRLQAYGNSSRIALVAFTTRCRLHFPSDGMAQIDAETPPTTIHHFKDCIATLRQEDAGTDIGQALQFAATHLANYGKPWNKRVIVLLSDGADWHIKGNDATGEMLGTGVEDPVSLMEHLHHAMNIELHAVGISDDGLYSTYCRTSKQRSHPSLAPNHALLRELLRVGGGNPERIGDTSVLDDYFRGLGAGISQTIRPRSRRTAPRTLSDAARGMILGRASQTFCRNESATAAQQAECEELTRRLRAHYEACNQKARMVGTFALWVGDWTTTTKQFENVDRGVTDEHSFGSFAKDMYVLIDEMLPSDIRKWKADKDLSPAAKRKVAEYLHASPTIKYLSTFRHKAAHGMIALRSDESTGDAYGEVATASEYFLGVKYVPKDDAAGWGALKKAVLEKVIALLCDIDAILEQFNRREPESALATGEEAHTPSDDTVHIVAEW